MLIGDSLVVGKMLDRSKLDLDSLEDEDKLVVNNSEVKNEDAEDIGN